jgi:uncharacterized protein YyaL (SSP411 family)
MAPALAKAPAAFSGMVAAADLDVAGIVEIAVTGDRPDLLDAVRTAYRPGAVLAWGEPYASPLWEGRTGPDTAGPDTAGPDTAGPDTAGPDTAGRAFVCRDYACRAPVSTPEDLRAQLAG